MFLLVDQRYFLSWSSTAHLWDEEDSPLGFDEEPLDEDPFPGFFDDSPFFFPKVNLAQSFHFDTQVLSSHLLSSPSSSAVAGATFRVGNFPFDGLHVPSGYTWTDKVDPPKSGREANFVDPWKGSNVYSDSWGSPLYES